MSRFDRILRRTDRGPAHSDESDPTAVLPAEDPGSSGADATAPDAPAETPSVPSTGPVAAGAEPPERPLTRRRSRARRRLRHLQRARELLLRDLGGLVYEVHRSPAAATGHATDELVARKVERLRRVDDEIRQLGAALDARTDVLVVRQPGVGGTCASCGELYASDARFCQQCGTRVGGATPSSPAAEAGAASPEPARPAEVGAEQDARVTVNAGDNR